MTRTCSQRSLDADAVDGVELVWAAVACARAPSGRRSKAVPATIVAFAKKPRVLSDITSFAPEFLFLELNMNQRLPGRRSAPKGAGAWIEVRGREEKGSQKKGGGICGGGGAFLAGRGRGEAGGRPDSDNKDRG